ncbi:hypothetical protein [Ectothiorhodospira mobilis]|uniref:hypothetical protein n=1 Tax=Ectothiorhodospira mobilis TaxID=195064 RepID=UPI001EE85BA5|nr:hypothetical protein [Ectothiorhodospira mobilis]MCG5535066.1 hypothetical protein [Ectothiorhodospira mobilis]
MSRAGIEPAVRKGHEAWRTIWEQLDAAERSRAVIAFLERLRDPAARLERVCDATLKTLARRKRFRVETLKRMGNPQLAEVLLPHVPAVLGAREWTLLFLGYFADYKTAIMCRFLDLCGVEHDERGFVVGGDERIRPPRYMEAVTATLVESFGVREVALYFGVLRLMDPDLWHFLEPVLPGLWRELEAQGEKPEEGAGPVSCAPTPAREGGGALDVSEDFTQLDRVIIEQILATLSRQDRALTPDELVDLVESVHALDTGRQRTYFHLGFLDALLPGRAAEMNRPEMNDGRRHWYLSGLLAGHVRQRDHEAVKTCLRRHADALRAASAIPGGAGASLVNEVYPYLLEAGFTQEAIRLLRGQRRHLTARTVRRVLESAARALHAGEAELANVLLVELKEGMPHAALDAEEQRELHPLLERRLGQALQARGNFAGARTLYQGLLESGGGEDPGLLADMGLVLGGFRSLEELELPQDAEQGRNLLAQLRNGRPYFSQALERFGRAAVAAHYALGFMGYLTWVEAEGLDAGREEALDHVNEALVGLMSDAASLAAEHHALLDRCRFMQSVLLMARLDRGSARAAMEAWRAIAGEMPALAGLGVQRLMECADLVDPALAAEIAEAVWRRHGESAPGIVERPEWIARSAYLLDALLALCRESAGRDKAGQWRLWSSLVSAALSAGRVEMAQEGLDALESLAADSRFCQPLLAWLEAPERVDPAWSETEVLRARVRLYRRLGKDAEAFAQLRALFFALRDTRPVEAGQILGLFREYGASPEHYADLSLPAGEAAETGQEADLDRRLQEGAEVTVLFVGGNETQARHAEEVIRTVAADWPGVRVIFRLTGWSSNWGREVDALARQAAEADAVVLMTMMRTLLGRALREALNDPPRPWVPCTGTGRGALVESIRRAARVGLRMTLQESP